MAGGMRDFSRTDTAQIATEVMPSRQDKVSGKP